MRRVPLPSGSESKSYYPFIDVPLVPLSAEELRELPARRDDAEALQFADRARSQLPTHQPESSGVRRLRTGGVLFTAITETPDITADMANWWVAWHQLDPLRYALWNPEDHFGIQINDVTRQRLLDPAVPIAERAWGTQCVVTESMNGDKPTTIDIPFADPGTVGYDRSLIGTDACQNMMVSNSSRKIGPFEMRVFMAEGLRVGPNGRNQWVARWWIGCGVVDGKDTAARLPAPLRMILERKMGILVAHSFKEMRHLNTVLPALYAEHKDNWRE